MPQPTSATAARRSAPMGRLARRVRDDERGAGYLAAFIVLFSVLTVAGVGILVDSARILATDRQCSAIALEAARAGANAIDVDAVRAGTTAVDPAQAQAAAVGSGGRVRVGVGCVAGVGGGRRRRRDGAGGGDGRPVVPGDALEDRDAGRNRAGDEGGLAMYPPSRGERAGRGRRRGHRRRRRCRCRRRPDAPSSDGTDDRAVDAPAHRPGRSRRRGGRGRRSRRKRFGKPHISTPTHPPTPPHSLRTTPIGERPRVIRS